MGQLLDTLSVERYGTFAALGLDLSREVDEGRDGRCLAEAPSQLQSDQDALFKEVMQEATGHTSNEAADTAQVAPIAPQITVAEQGAQPPATRVEFVFGSHLLTFG